MRQPTDPARCARCAPGALCHNHAGPGDVSAEQILDVVRASETTTPADIAATAREQTGGHEYVEPAIRWRAFTAGVRRRKQRHRPA